MRFEIEGITVDVQRKQIKSLRLSVKAPDGRVCLSVPWFVSDELIRAHLRENLDWIRERQAAVVQLPPEREPYANGETLYLWGRPYTLRVMYGDEALVLRGDEALLTVRRGSSAEQREAFVNEWYRALLKEKIAQLLPKWERITGLYCSGWQTKNMKTRWGTCNTETRKIWLNLQLAKRPVECLEYVILHELAHLRVPGHGEDFKALLDRYMPCWRSVKKTLDASCGY